MSWPLCHSLRQTHTGSIALCAHPQVHVRGQRVTPAICNSCRQRTLAPPPTFRDVFQVSEEPLHRGRVELVVAKYKEDVSWLNRFEGLDRVVYDKG